MFETPIEVRLYDEYSGTYFSGKVFASIENHAFLQNATRGKSLDSAKNLIKHMLNNPDTWDLICETTNASIKTKNFVRVETYKIGEKGMFFEIEEQEGVVLSGCLQLRKYRNQIEVSGNLKVITYLGQKEVCCKSTYHPGTYGLWQRGDEMVVACNSYGHLVAVIA